MSFLRRCVCVLIWVVCTYLSCWHALEWCSRLVLKEQAARLWRTYRGITKPGAGGSPQDPRMALDPELEMEAFNSDARKWFLANCWRTWKQILYQSNFWTRAHPAQHTVCRLLRPWVRSQPSCDQTPNSEKLWYTKCALVKATQFVLICNTARENNTL